MASSNNNNDFTAAVVSLLRQAEYGTIFTCSTDMNMHRNENRINTSNGASIGTQSSTVAVEDQALANFRQLFAPYSNSHMPSPLPSASLGRGRVRVLTDPAKRSKKRAIQEICSFLKTGGPTSSYA